MWVPSDIYLQSNLINIILAFTAVNDVSLVTSAVACLSELLGKNIPKESDAVVVEIENAVSNLLNMLVSSHKKSLADVDEQYVYSFQNITKFGCSIV